MLQRSTRRSRAVCELVVIALVVIAGSLSMTPAVRANGSAPLPSSATPTPTVSPTPSVPSSPTSNSTGPKPNFVISGNITGQSSNGAPSNAYCNGHLYTGWTGGDDHVNVAWDFNGSGFSGQVTYSDTTYYNHATNPTTYTRPILACWNPSSGPYAGTTRLWILFTGTNKVLYLGYFDPSDVNHGFETIPIHVHTGVPNQTSVLSPAMATQGGTLRIGWVGVGNGYLNFESTTNGTTFYSPNVDRDSTADGGFGMTVWCNPGCNLWFAYPGTDSSHHIFVEYFGLSSGVWTDPNGAHPTADYTCALCDLTLVAQGSTLRIPYSGATGNLNIDNSTNGANWSNDQGDALSLWGAGAAVDGSNHFWVTFPYWLGYGSSPLEIDIFQYN